MRKLFYILLLFFLTPLFAPCEEIQNEFIQKGSFIPVYPTKTFSTAIIDEGDIFYFIVPSDMWVEECKVIPKNSIVRAKVSMLKMPVTGINAAVKIDSDIIIFPDGSRHLAEGFITTNGDRQIGGDLTPPLSYNKTLHPRKGEYFNATVAQYVPSGEYEFGQHITIPVSQMLKLVLLEDFYPY